MGVSEIASEAAALASAVDPLVASVSPLAGTVVALVAAALKAEPAVVALIEAIIADFKGSPPVAGPPLDFKDQSAALEVALHKKP